MKLNNYKLSEGGQMLYINHLNISLKNSCLDVRGGETLKR
jgi:hypothetical protein